MRPESGYDRLVRLLSIDPHYEDLDEQYTAYIATLKSVDESVRAAGPIATESLPVIVSIEAPPKSTSVASEPSKPAGIPWGKYAGFAAAVLLFAGLAYAWRPNRALAIKLEQYAEVVDSAAYPLGSENHDLPISPMKARGLGSIAFLPELFSTTSAQPQGTIDLTIQNDSSFPCFFTWTVGGVTRHIEVHRDGVRVALPSGDVRFTVEAMSARGWGQPYTTVHNGNVLGTALGATLLRLKPGDTLLVHFEQPFAPWNAVMIRIKGEWAMVTLERAWADFDVDKLRRRQWREVDPDREELPNTALFWAREKSAGLAAELAKSFVASRRDQSRSGRVRGRMHTSLQVPANKAGVAEVFQNLSAHELVTHLVEAFEILRKQRPPLGPSIQEEIDSAAKLLREGLNADLKAIPSAKEGQAIRP